MAEVFLKYFSGKRGPDLQAFNFAKYSTDENPVYECTIAPSGCHHDDDCHYTFGVYCSCYGDSCIRYRHKKSANGNTRPYATKEYESGWAWQGCGWYIWGSRCHCEKENSYRKPIWPVVWREYKGYYVKLNIILKNKSCLLHMYLFCLNKVYVRIMINVSIWVLHGKIWFANLQRTKKLGNQNIIKKPDNNGFLKKNK